MKFYDLLIVFDVAGKKREKILKEVEAVILEKGGVVEKIEEWGVRRLAYPIKRRQDGFYLILRFTALPERIKVIEDLLRREEEVLRFLATRRKEAISEEVKEEVVAEKEERDEGILKSDSNGEFDEGS